MTATAQHSATAEAASISDGWLQRIFEANADEERAKADFAEARDHLLEVKKRRKELNAEFNDWMRGQLGLPTGD